MTKLIIVYLPLAQEKVFFNKIVLRKRGFKNMLIIEHPSIKKVKVKVYDNSD